MLNLALLQLMAALEAEFNVSHQVVTVFRRAANSWIPQLTQNGFGLAHTNLSEGLKSCYGARNGAFQVWQEC